MNFFKTSKGIAINLAHVVYVQQDESKQEAKLFALGMPQPITITNEDYDSLTQLISFSEAKMMVDVMEFSPLTFEQSMRMLTELMLHFVAHSIAAQNGTLKDFPTSMVYERIANLMHVLNTTGEINGEEDIQDEKEDDDNGK